MLSIMIKALFLMLALGCFATAARTASDITTSFGVPFAAAILGAAGLAAAITY